MIAPYFLAVAAIAAVPVVAEGAWVREAAPTAPAMAAYLTLKNPGKAPLTLVGASSPQFKSVELHEIVEANGMTSMQEVKSLALPAGGQVMFVPGGTHVMLIGPKAPLPAGSPVTITFKYEGGATTVVKTAVKAKVAAPAAGHDHHH